MRTTCRPGTPCSVLMIEDDTNIAALLTSAVSRFETGCFSIETAPTLADAVAKLGGIAYDALLVDLGLPDSDGLATLHVVQKLVQGRAPVMVLTGLYDAETEVCSFEAGAVDYITKPFDAARLLARIRHAILRHRHLSKLQADLLKEVALLRKVEPMVTGEPQRMLHEAANDVLRVATSFARGV